MSCILCAGKIEAAFQSNFNFAYLSQNEVQLSPVPQCTILLTQKHQIQISDAAGPGIYTHTCFIWSLN